MPQGIVRWFDTERGFGFLDLGEDAEDLFVHASEIVGDDNRKVLKEGQEVEFELGEGDRGPQARNVRVIGEYAADTPVGQLGTVSWYEPAKGYGFITPDSGEAEIFAHSSAIIGGGVLREGQRVAFMVVPGEKGPQAEPLMPLGANAAPAAVSDGADGTITFFDADKGFGFARPDAGGEDVFVHAKNLIGTVSLAEGDRISFTVTPSDRGPQAHDVRLVGGQARRGAPAGRGAPAAGRGAPAGRGRTERPRGSGAPVRGGTGTVARYDADRGFGFITPDAGGDDLFVHVSVVRGSDDGLYEGDRVKYEVRQSDRGPQADRVELL